MTFFEWQMEQASSARFLLLVRWPVNGTKADWAVVGLGCDCMVARHESMACCSVVILRLLTTLSPPHDEREDVRQHILRSRREGPGLDSTGACGW